MKLNLFSRTNSGTVRKTIQIYKEEVRHEIGLVWFFSILIPISHFLYGVLLPLLISFIVQSLIENPHDITFPLLLTGGILLTGVASLVIQHYAFIGFFNHEERMTTRLAKRAMNGLLAHSHAFFSNQKVGSLAGDVNTFSRSYLALMDTIFLQASVLIVGILTSLAVIAFIAPILLIPLLLLTGFVVGESLISLQRRSHYRNKRKEMQSKLFGSIADALGNQTLIRMFGAREREVKAIVQERQAIEHVASEEIDILQRSAEVRQGGLFIFQALTMLVAIFLVSHDLVSIAALIFTVTYLGRITNAMYNINSIIRTSEQAFLDASKVTEILAKDVEVKDVPGAAKLHISDASINIKGVSFSYNDTGNELVFDRLNLFVPAGQSVGLVGKSGGGKSTLTHLLLRYMDIEAGEILISNQNISQVTQDSLRENIAYVPQDSFLFHRTLRENINYGSINASEKKIDEAIKKAHADDFISKLPKGLDTVVGERGVKLSGGQRQRIAIARAILKDAPILVLDEATSALDSESEKYIQEALSELMKGRTSIVVAHRLSTIAKLDRIIVIDEGKIIEDGSHSELLVKKGVYSKLWNHQSGGFIEE